MIDRDDILQSQAREMYDKLVWVADDYDRMGNAVLAVEPRLCKLAALAHKRAKDLRDFLVCL